MERQSMKDEGEVLRAGTQGVLHMGGQIAGVETARLMKEIGISDAHMKLVIDSKKKLWSKAGSIAELAHAESFNLDAIVKGAEVKAHTDVHAGTPLRRHDPVVDIVLTGGDSPSITAQSKYCNTADNTATAMRKLDNGVPKYGDADILLAPSEQIEGVKSTAHRAELKNAQTRPGVSDAAKNVHEKVSDRLSKDGVESTPLAHKEATAVAKGGEAGETVLAERRDTHLEASTSKHTIAAARTAALTSTIIVGSVATFRCLSEVQNGRMDPLVATREILATTALAAGDAALKAGAATASVSLLARSAPTLFQGGAFQSSLVAGGVGGAAICAVDLVQCLVLVAAGRMTMAELEKRSGMNVFQTGAGVLGSTIGGALGAPGGPIGVMVGGFIGGLISSMAVTIAMDNHMEVAYRDTVRAATALVAAQNGMHRSVALLRHAEIAYQVFQDHEQVSEAELDQTLSKVESMQDQLYTRLISK